MVVEPVNFENWSPERVLLHGQILCLLSDLEKHNRREPLFATVNLSAQMTAEVLHAANAALQALDRLGYSYHGSELFKPPLGPASPAQAPVAASSMVTVPVLKSFDATVTVGELRLHRDHLPPLHDWHVGFGYTQQADGSQDLISAALVPDKLGGFGPKKDFTREEVEELLRQVRDTALDVFAGPDLKGSRDVVEFFAAEFQVELNKL